MVTITNQSAYFGNVPTGLPVVSLSIAPNATNVQTLTGTPSSGNSNYFTQTFAFSNNGSIDGMGLYRLPSEAGSELQMQVTGISCIPLQGQTGPTNLFTMQFTSGSQEPGVWDSGYYLPSAYNGAIVIANESTHSYTWSTTPGHPEFDSARIYQCALMANPVYMLLTSNVQSQSTLSNSSSLSLNWTYVPFLQNGSAFVVSRDNQAQCYDVNLPVTGLAALDPVYGPCTFPNPGIAELMFSPSPMTYSWVPHAESEMNILYASLNGFPFYGGFHAYLIIDSAQSYGDMGGAPPYGSVLALTITSTVATPPTCPTCPSCQTCQTCNNSNNCTGTNNSNPVVTTGLPGWAYAVIGGGAVGLVAGIGITVKMRKSARSAT
jgi:hypothetical protein